MVHNQVLEDYIWHLQDANDMSWYSTYVTLHVRASSHSLAWPSVSGGGQFSLIEL